MVEALLERFLGDLGITPEAFVKVCESPHSKINGFVFNQVAALVFLLFPGTAVAVGLPINRRFPPAAACVSCIGELAACVRRPVSRA